MIKKAILFTILLTFFYLTPSITQEIKWKAGFNSFFDNREYFNDYAEPGSILGARTFAEAGFSIDDKNSFSVGLDFMYEFGDKTRVEHIKPILYYHHFSQSTEIYMGAFPRRGLVNLPFVMQSDTFNYYRPNVEGIFLKFQNSWGRQDVWLDWTSRQTIDQKETFLIGATGQTTQGKIFGRYDFIMYHYAGKAILDPGEHLRDNGGATAIIGANLSGFTPLDTLMLTTGGTMSYDRLRGVYDMKFYLGSITELLVGYKMFSIRNTLYLGDGQVNCVGDKMYTAPFYDRTDFIWNLFRKGPAKGVVEFSLHFLPETLDFSQKFTIYIDINGHKSIKRKPVNSIS